MPSARHPATPEQRKAITFKGETIQFKYTNDEWISAHLVTVRLAIAALEKDDKELQQITAELVRDGVVPNLLDGLTATKEHLETLANAISTLLTRHFVVLERLGYDPDNLPPDGVVH
jgi:hypothetical protein